MIRLAAAILLSLAGLLLRPGLAVAGPEEERCLADIVAARELAAGLPSVDLSRRFAEHALDTALTEMNAGEVDDCPDLVEHARTVIATRPYVLRPGERFGLPPR